MAKYLLILLIVACSPPKKTVEDEKINVLKVHVIYADSTFKRPLGARFWDSTWSIYSTPDSLIEKLYKMWQRDKCNHQTK